MRASVAGALARARYSVDVDLPRTGQDATVDSAVEALVVAASVDLDDHLTFSHYDTSREMSAGRPTRKVRFEVRFGLRQLRMVSVDVVATDHLPLGELVDKPLEAPFTVEASAHNATPSGEVTHAALHAEVRRRRRAGGHVPFRQPSRYRIGPG